jgi:hypothetical protein
VIRWDKDLKEYYIVHGRGRRMCMSVYFCPFCGGRTPKSRRDLLFHTLTDAESLRLLGLMKDKRSVREVIAAFGEPDVRRDAGWLSSAPERDGKPETVGVSPVMIYSKLSKVADVYVTIGPSDRVGVTLVPKVLKEDESRA